MKERLCLDSSKQRTFAVRVVSFAHLEQHFSISNQQGSYPTLLKSGFLFSKNAFLPSLASSVP